MTPDTQNKAAAIRANVIISKAKPDNTPGQVYYDAIIDLANACALLTSISKDEREQGKLMVRRWKARAPA